MMLSTPRLLIRLLEFNDLETLRDLHNSEDTLQWLTDIFHVTREEQKAWFLKINMSRRNRRYTVLSKETSEIVGLVRLDEIDLVNRNAIIGLDIGINFRRQGFASEIYECIINYAFNALNLHRLSLVTLENNIAAQNLYTKLGFKKEGVLTEAILRDGEFKNLICMYKINSKFLG